VHLKYDGTRAETRFRLSPKRTSPFKSVGASVQLTAGSWGARISVSNAGYAMFWGSGRVLATHSICQFPLHFPSCASPCVIRFQTRSNSHDTSALYYEMYKRNVMCLHTVNKIKQKEGKCVCLAECFIRFQRHTELEDRLKAVKKI